MCDLLEYSYEEMKGKQLFDFMDGEGKKPAKSRLKKENRASMETMM